MKNPSKLLFFSLLILGTLISISANSWPATWMGLEINLLAFIPLMTSKSNILSSEASMKYFLIQAMASSMFLMFIILTFISSMNIELSDSLNQVLISSTLLIKMGAAPFHFWFPSVMEGLTWLNCLTLMTWQKLAPMMILTYFMTNEMLMIIITISSIIIGSIGGLNQTSTRKIMAYSSINHIGWMMMAIMCAESLWMTYFLIYSTITTVMILFLMKTSSNHFNQINFKLQDKPEIKMLIIINMMSLGGLPPFLGFLPKWMVIQSSLENNFFLITLFMVVLTLITLFYYMRLSTSSLMLINSQIKWLPGGKYNLLSLMLFSTISTLGLTLYPLLFYNF